MNVNCKLGPIVVASILALCAGQIAIAQVDWTWGDLCVEPGLPGSWDSANHQLGDIVFDGTTYHMYLVGGQTVWSWESPFAVGHWTSTSLDGPWAEDPAGNPVLEPEPGQWDGFTIYNIAVRYDGASFWMWYGAAAGTWPDPVYVGLATNTDGWGDWDKDPGNPLPGLVPGASGEWDDSGVIPSTVLFVGSVYRMWYTAIKDDGGNGDWSIGYASSTNGLTWTKYPDPLLVGTEPWEGDNLYFPVVIPSGGGFAMWYTALVWGQMVNIGYATSPDGLHWGKWPSNPVLTPTPPCDVADSFAVMIEGDTIHGWTNTCDNDIYHVTSPLEVVFFDTFETGDTIIWSNVVP